MHVYARACFNFSSFPKAFAYCSAKSGVLTSCFKSRGIAGVALAKIWNQMLPKGWCIVHAARGSHSATQKEQHHWQQKQGHRKTCLNATSDVYAPWGLARHMVLLVNPMKLNISRHEHKQMVGNNTNMNHHEHIKACIMWHENQINPHGNR